LAPRAAHGRCEAVFADREPRRLQVAVGVLGRGDEELCADLGICLGPRLESDDRRTRLHRDGLLAVALVGQGQRLASRRGRDLGDGRVGHHAVGLQIPGIVPFAHAAHVLGKQQHLERVQRTVGALQRGDADEAVLLDVGHGDRHDQQDAPIVGQIDLGRRAFTGRHSDRLVVDGGDRAAQPGRRSLGSLSQGYAGGNERKERNHANGD
jgi:hypothetical protein